MTTVYIGNSVGPLIGGMSADRFGYEATFFLTGGFLLAGGLIVFLLVDEKFERPDYKKGTSLQSIFRLAGSRQILPLLIIQFSLQAGPNLVAPILSLLMQQ